MGKRERVGEEEHFRPLKQRCRRVHFHKDVKKHDGLRPDTRIFEELILAYTMNRETVDAKSLLLFLESKNLLHILESMRVQMEKTIERTKIFQQEKRNINPMLVGGGGHGFGIMPRDMPSLVLIRDLLNRASKIMSEYNEFTIDEKTRRHSPTSVHETPGSEPMSLKLP